MSRNSKKFPPLRGRPTTVTVITQDTIEKIHDMIIGDRQVTQKYPNTSAPLDSMCKAWKVTLLKMKRSEPK